MKPATKVLLKWALLVGMFLAIYQFLAPDGRRAAPSPAPDAPPDTAWISTLVMAAVVIGVVLGLRRLIKAGQVHGAALRASHAHLEAGRYEEAERAVEGLARSRLAKYWCAHHLQRAVIAARRGDRDEALARIDPAVAGPPGRLVMRNGRLVSQEARGLRAFLRASAGDEAGARADLDAIAAMPDPSAWTLAQGALAEALILDRRGDRAALRDHLAGRRRLVMEASGARERALFRAFEAMTEAAPASVYRQKGEPATGSEGAAIAAWVARYAPSAAPFVRLGAAGSGAGGEIEAPSEEGRRKVEAARPRPVKNPQSAKTLGLWVVLVLGFLAVWQASTTMSLPDFAAPLLVLALAGGFIAWIARNVLRGRAEQRRLDAAVRALGEGDLERATADLGFEPSNPMRRAHAEHLRAEVALRGGEMEAAVAACDRSFRALAEAQGGTLGVPVAPPAGVEVTWDFQRVVAAQRAFALAALGREDEARAEVEWAKGFPDGLPAFRVRLMGRLSAGDLAGAADVAEGRTPTMRLPARDEALADVARFAGGGSRPAAEAARLRAELRRDPELARWIARVAPALAAAFQQAAAEAEAGAGATA